MKPGTLRTILGIALAGAFLLTVAWMMTRPALPSPAPVVATAPIETPAAESATVVAVVDGDTLDVRLDTQTVRVRVLGIDTPEIGRHGKPDDCYAQEARTFLDEHVFGKTVRLDADPTQADTDKYGRLIRYVTQDGQDVALAALTAGMGTEYTYARPYTRQAAYRAAEATAHDAGAGLWGACTRGTTR